MLSHMPCLMPTLTIPLTSMTPNTSTAPNTPELRSELSALSHFCPVRALATRSDSPESDQKRAQIRKCS